MDPNLRDEISRGLQQQQSRKVPEEALQRSALLANVVLGLYERAEPRGTRGTVVSKSNV